MSIEDDLEPIFNAYKKYIRREKTKGLVSSLTSAILSIASNDPELSSDDAITLVKEATDKAVAIIAKIEGEQVK